MDNHKMKFVGAHVSTNGGIDQSIIRAHKIGATALAFFLKNQLRWESPLINSKVIKKFYENCKKYNYTNLQILPHASYLINLGHPKIDILKKSQIALLKEVQYCEILNIKLINFHPGNYLNLISIEECLKRISDSINFILSKSKCVNLLIENTAGQGFSVGFKFEHLSKIISNIEDKKRVGVCFDTCHAFAAGYDLRTKKNCDDVFSLFDKIIGLEYLKGIHLNDSKKHLHSNVDRHENLGSGFIGNKAFIYIMEDKRFDNIPIILETKNSKKWKSEIEWLKFYSNSIAQN